MDECDITFLLFQLGLPDGWVEVAPTDRGSLSRELEAEVSLEHPLAGVRCLPLLRCHRCNDVLFACSNPKRPLALVRLTLSSKQELPPYPRTRFFDSAAHWSGAVGVVCGQPGDWRPFSNGSTIGTPGSEGGRVLLDEEHTWGMRICLEQTGDSRFAITCGVYGAMVHTCCFASDAHARAEYDKMKPRLVAISHALPLVTDLDLDFTESHRLIRRFIADFA